jgi:hypothetical protein
MQHEYACIEQLDLAARQLANQEPAFARFALILTDNIIELMLYRKCENVFVQDDGYFSYGRQFGGAHLYDAATRARVLSQHFGERPRFCRRLGILTDDEMEFILHAHRYRNEVYHVGILHDDILYPIAWQYHDLACEVFERLSPLYGVWSSNDIVSDTVARHTGPEGIRIHNADEDIAAATASLKASKAALAPTFHERLCEAALRRIEDFDGALYSLIEDGHRDEAELLQELQFRDYITAEGSPHLAEFAALQTLEQYQAFSTRVRPGWQPRFPASPVERWTRRAEGLRREVRPAVAMRKFQALLDEMEPLAQIAFKAAREYENYCQLEADLRRGK